MKNLKVLGDRAEILNNLHLNSANKAIFISDGILGNSIIVKGDKRLINLIWTLYVETIEEIRENLPDLKDSIT
jgi:hypothetical protein